MPSVSAAKQFVLSNKAGAMITLILTATLALVAYFMLPAKVLPSCKSFLPNHFFFDPSRQHIAHRALVVGLAIFGLLLPLTKTRLGRVLGPITTRRINVIAASLRTFPAWTVAAVLPVCLWAHRGVGRDQYILGMGLTFLILAFGCRFLGNIWLRRVILAVLLSLITVLLASGFLGPYSFGTRLAHSCYHYYIVFGMSKFLAMGAGLLENTRYFYGLFPQSILAVIDMHAGPLPILFYVRVVQVSLVVFTLVSLYCYVRLAPGRPLVWALCVLFWLPWLMTTGGDGITPTNSGLRPLGLALMPAVLLLAQDLERYRQSVLLGATAGLCLLWNMETGICAAVGLVGYCITSERPNASPTWLRRLGAFCLGLAAMIGVQALILRLGLGYWPPFHQDSLLFFIRLNSSIGFGGIPWEFDPLSLVIFLYPVLLLARLTESWLRKRLTQRMRFKFALCVTHLLWGAYYAHRAWSYALYLSAFLFTLLVADILPRPRNWRFRWDGLGAALCVRIPASAVFCTLLFGPTLADYGLTGVKDVYKKSMDRRALAARPGAATFGGLWMSGPDAERLNLQKQYLMSAPREQKIFFVSAEQFLLQLETGRIFPMPVQDLYWESFTEEFYETDAASIERYAPDLVLLDMVSRKALAEDLHARLSSSYARRDAAGGWVILERDGLR